MKKRYPPVTYHNLWFRICAAIGVSHFLMFYGDERTFWSSLTTWIYYKSLIENFIIAFFLICLVHIITKMLDRHSDWKRDFFYRFVLQLAFGVCVPVIFAVCLAMVFCYVNHIDIYKSDYFTLALPLIKIMIILLNIYYFIHYYYIKMKKDEVRFSEFRSSLQERQDGTPAIAVTGADDGPGNERDGLDDDFHSDSQHIFLEAGDGFMRFHVRDEIAYFTRKKDNYWIMTFSGKLMIIRDSLKKVNDLCKGFDFLHRINKWTIINYDAIETSEYIRDRRVYKIKVKDNIAGELENDKSQWLLEVNRNNFSTFRDWMENNGGFH